MEQNKTESTSQDAKIQDMESDSFDETPLDWNTIPNELLLKIFNKLVHSSGESSLTQQKKNLLNSRLVSTRWKCAMDSKLADGSIQTWKKFENRRKTKHVFRLCQLKLMSMRKPEFEWVLCPPHIDLNADANQFPTKSLKVTELQPESQKRFESYQLMDVSHFFSKLGHHLASLSFNHLPTISLETLQSILNTTSNLKALTLQNVELYVNLPEERWSIEDMGVFSLPELPHIQHLRVFNTQLGTEEMHYRRSCRSIHDNGFDLYKWIVEPYNQQLLTLDVDCSLESLEKIESDFAMLNRLVVSLPGDFISGTASFKYPQLQCLWVDVFGDFSLQALHSFLAGFSETLVELHLDLPRYVELHHYPAFHAKDAKIWSTSKTVFSKLTTFSFVFSKFPEEVVVLRGMLSCFPKLENLNLIRLDEENEEIETNIQKASKHVEQEQYWTICQNLKIITVRREQPASFMLDELTTPLEMIEMIHDSKAVQEFRFDVGSRGNGM